MDRLIVVGNGMAGIACLEQILKHSERFDITVFGNETHVNYNRILLSAVLAGEKSADEIVLNGLDWYRDNTITLRLGVHIMDIDPTAKTVSGNDGTITSYNKLILATGSSPPIPPIEGVQKPGVYLFRNLDDTRAILDHACKGARAVVIGGGLLGLEAARGLQVQGCQVTVVHLMDTLMERQLDLIAGGYLKAQMECLGVKVELSRNTAAILGDHKVTGVRFKDGVELPADLVVIAAGIRPNVELARKAQLRVNRGIVVNDFLETSDPHISAVGECVEHNGMCYGLVAPLIEQGEVLAATITGNRGPRYQGSVLAAKLKIMGVDVFSAGDFNESTPENDVVRYEDQALGISSGQAYTKGVRMVKTCVGTDFCRFGVQDAIAAGVELERRFENLFTPHKLKMGVVGCPRNCAEATVKDIGLIGQEGSWHIVVGGAAGKKVRKADLLVTVETAEEALQTAALFFQYYRENANYLERTYDFVERVGIERVRRETIYAPIAVQQGLRERLKKSKSASHDAWLEGETPRNPTQFLTIEPLENLRCS